MIFAKSASWIWNRQLHPFWTLSAIPAAEVKHNHWQQYATNQYLKHFSQIGRYKGYLKGYCMELARWPKRAKCWWTCNRIGMVICHSWVLYQMRWLRMLNSLNHFWDLKVAKELYMIYIMVRLKVLWIKSRSTYWWLAQFMNLWMYARRGMKICSTTVSKRRVLVHYSQYSSLI